MGDIPEIMVDALEMAMPLPLPTKVRFLVKIESYAVRAIPAARHAATGFAQGQLERHFRKHAAEWGAGNITRAGYLKRAQSLLRSNVGGDIVGHVRANGDVLRYNVRTNEFAIGAANGTIRTLFRPSEGMSYWLRQVAP
jgi:pyocin large subunit-like protein